ncbi:YihY/virulence factor BrkB family protein [Virgibacillus necropolis]|uniref:Ribonuclease n=1 Tax=Virgibacillus necropolis TaxID=163877 RepID=A0A221MH14_9BACI|nr:YihY/virulence factor BrkB family protein [Virgibacillus necropolis]ASN06902.1 ribonuclease [Virgibacillus necropolis]
MKKAVTFSKQLFQKITEVDVFGMAAQLAYFLLLSLFPFLLFLVTLIGYLPIDPKSVISFIGVYAPGEIMDLISTNINQLSRNQNGGLLSIGIIGTIWSASAGINAIMKAFNGAYEVDEDRSFIVSRLIAIVLTVAMVVVICIAFILPIFGKMIGDYLFSFLGWSSNFIQVWETLRWVISSIVFLIVLLALYKLAPNQRVLYKDAIWGAIFATIGWQLVSLAFSYYLSTIGSGSYSATYGSLGTVITLMIWFYLSGIIIITGGVINAIFKHRRVGRLEI